MESIPVGQTASTEQMQSTGPDIGSGYCDQWQRALEKAYLEKQVDVMRSTGTQDTGKSSVREIFPGGPRLDPFQQNRALSEKNGMMHALLTPTAVAGMPQVVFPAENSPDKSAQLVLSRPTPVIPGRHLMVLSETGPTNTNAVVSSRHVPAPLQFVLPPPSSIIALAKEQGVHVVIRDASIENADVLRLILKIREVLVEGHKRLIAVTLNGQRVWENQDLAAAPDSAILAKKGINRLY